MRQERLMARPKKMSGRVAFYVPPGVIDDVQEIVRLRTERQAGLEARAADVYREAVVRGLPLVLAAERGEIASSPARVPAALKRGPKPRSRRA
jgi:hypothetical protein